MLKVRWYDLCLTGIVRLETMLPMTLGVSFATLMAIGLLPGRQYLWTLLATAACVSVGCVAAFGFADFRRRRALMRLISRFHEGRLPVQSPELRDSLGDAIKQLVLIDRALQMTGLYYYPLRCALDCWMHELIQTLSVYDAFVHHAAVTGWVASHAVLPPELHHDRLGALRNVFNSGLRHMQHSHDQARLYHLVHAILARPPSSMLGGIGDLARLSQLVQEKRRVSTLQLLETQKALHDARSALASDAVHMRRLLAQVCAQAL